MPITTVVDTTQRCVFMQVQGTATAEELRAHYEKIISTPGFDSGFDSCADLRGVTKMSVPTSSMRGFFAMSPYGPSSQRAFILTSEMVQGMIRMLELSSEGRHGTIAVFAEPQEAYDWLRVSPPRG